VNLNKVLSVLRLNRDEFMVPILEPIIPNVYNFLLFYVPVCTKYDSYTTHNRVF
jgi:hypothetical protein